MPAVSAFAVNQRRPAMPKRIARHRYTSIPRLTGDELRAKWASSLIPEILWTGLTTAKDLPNPQRERGIRVAAQEQSSGASTMKIGIIGAGRIGAVAARLFVAAGHEVAFSNSRGPMSLHPLVRELGGHA